MLSEYLKELTKMKETVNFEECIETGNLAPIND